MAFLFTVVGANINEKFELDLPGRGAHVLGREGADIKLADPAISNRHAELISVEGSWIVRDLGSAGGTYVNNKRIGSAVKLRDNDQIRVGATILLFSAPIRRVETAAAVKKELAEPGRQGLEFGLYEIIDSAVEAAADVNSLLVAGAKAVFGLEYVDCVYVVIKEPHRLGTVAELHKPNTDCILYSSIAEQVFESSKPVFVDEVSKYRSGRSVHHEGSLRCVFAYPVKTGGIIEAVMYAGSCRAGAFKEAQMSMLGYFGLYLGASVDKLRLLQSAKQNQRLTDAGQTAAVMSHTIKNIVQAIGGASEVVDYAFESGKFDRARGSWDILKKNLERIRKFALEMLAFSRESKAIFTSCTLNRLIESAIESLKGKAAEKGVSLALELDENIPDAKLDSDKIHDVVLNLVMNAIDAVDENKGVIKIHTEFVEPEKAVRITIKDNGPGIKPEDLDKIFLPFHTTKAKTGTGLGLAIVKRTIEEHSGKITVESTFGEGAVFTIVLPIQA